MMSKSEYRKKAVILCLDNEFKDRGWFFPAQLHERINQGMKRDGGRIQYLPNTHSFITRRSCSVHCKTLFLKGVLERRWDGSRQVKMYRYGKSCPVRDGFWEPSGSPLLSQRDDGIIRGQRLNE